MPSSPPSDTAALPVTIADVEDAARRLDGIAFRTPLLECPAADEATGARVLVKAEALQRTGAFKYRGAWNRISRLDPDALKRGVVAYSSGNHGQAVAAVAKRLGAPAVIVMPADAPAMKIEATRAHGAEIVNYDRLTESREAIGGAIAAERGSTLVPPFDDPFIIAGQGTAGLEIAEQAAALGAAPDIVLVPCSGGGLVAGVAIAVKSRFPGAAVLAVEPEGFDDTARSLAAGRREGNAPGAHSFCDALLVAQPGEITFAINSRLLAGGISVPDAETAKAMEFAFRHLKLVLEPGGAIALAALLSGRLDARGKCVAVMASGGNVDAATYARALKGA
jgi:threonine dehydratase